MYISYEEFLSIIEFHGYKSKDFPPLKPKYYEEYAYEYMDEGDRDEIKDRVHIDIAIEVLSEIDPHLKK